MTTKQTLLMPLAGGILLLGMFQECTSKRHGSLQTQDRHKEERRQESREKFQSEQDSHEEKPTWIKMMNDPNVNYFEAVNSFNKYWEGRPVPEETDKEEERENESGERKEAQGEEETEAEAHPLRIEYKKFNSWKREVYPYVQPDGSIMTPQQQMEIYKNQRK